MGTVHVAHVLQRVHIVANLRANARLLHVALRIGVLSIDERLRLGAAGILQPAVIVLNLCPEIIVCYRNGLGIWRRRQT